jgi:hypothetical protein
VNRPGVEPVVVHAVRVDSGDGEARLSCHLRAPDHRLPAQLWFRFPPEADAYVRAIGDPFLPPLLLFCMKAALPLRIEADVSALLMSAVPSIQDIYAVWAADKGHRLTRIEVTAGTAVRPRQGQSSGAFFSCGVDSFYTLLCNARRYPSSDSRSIQHLLLVHGFDIPLERRELFEQVAAHARHTAFEHSKTLLTIATNVRAVTSVVDWGYYGHGAALASVGLALGDLVHTVFIPSTVAFVDLKPWGSHPALDPLWSTEQVELVHDGAETTRIDKVRLVATSPDALRALRVCWTNPNGAYNCGRCEKCLRTMAELEVIGALPHAAMFPDELDLQALEGLVILESARSHWVATVEAARDSVRHTRLTAAIESTLRRNAGISRRLLRALPPELGRPPVLLSRSLLRALKRFHAL